MCLNLNFRVSCVLDLTLVHTVRKCSNNVVYKIYTVTIIKRQTIVLILVLVYSVKFCFALRTEFGFVVLAETGLLAYHIT